MINTLDYTLPDALDGSALTFIHDTLERSYNLRSSSIKGRSMRLVFAKEEDSEVLAGHLKRLEYIARNINRDVIFEQPVAGSHAENPQVELERRGDVQKVANGMYLLQGPVLAIHKRLNRMVYDVAMRYAAVEQEYPTLWPIDLYKKINYFKEFPQQVILCAPLKRDRETLSSFAQTYAADREYDSVPMGEHMDDAVYGLESAVCDCCYYALQGARSYENTVYTCYNKVFRNEFSKIDSLDRMINFSVRDIMFVGEEQFVLTMRQHMLDEAEALVRRLRLGCRIETANDPFFSNDAAVKNVFQFAQRLKYEIQATLPFSGDSISVGSVNLHQDFFGRAFDIRLPGGEPVHSGCLGIGFERLVYALYCQYGPDESAWPADVRRELELDQA